MSYDDEQKRLEIEDDDEIILSGSENDSDHVFEQDIESNEEPEAEMVPETEQQSEREEQTRNVKRRKKDVHFGT
jgi:hypothetical protein